MLFFSNKKLNATFLFCAILLCVHQKNEMALSELNGLSPVRKWENELLLMTNNMCDEMENRKLYIHRSQTILDF